MNERNDLPINVQVIIQVEVPGLDIETQAGAHSLTSAAARTVATLPSGPAFSPCDSEASILRLGFTTSRLRTAEVVCISPGSAPAAFEIG
jgi:DNA-binding transcriptional MocR family regulator